MEIIRKILARLKEYELISLAIAICYFAGYFSFSYYYRLLGLSSVSGTTLEYLTCGGDFFISSIIKTIEAPIDNPSSFLSNLFWGEFKFPSWILIAAIVLNILRSRWMKFRTARTVPSLFFGLLVAFNLLLIGWQGTNLHIDNVLTVNPQRMYLEFKSKADYTPCELMDETYQQHLNFLEVHSPVIYKRIDKWFNMKSTEDLSENRLVSYSGLCFLFILGVFFWSMIKSKFENKLLWNTLIALSLIVNSIFLPISYGILGKSYRMPYSIVKFKTPTDSLKNRIYVLKEEENRYIVYDKMNFFQIKYISKSEVKELDQLYTLTPFQSPLNKQFSLCDSLLIIPTEIDY